MVENHYRWDFIGLSTDTKPTPATSEKVVDGSTFYCSDNSKLYVFYKDTWYEKTVSGGGGGTSDFDQLTNRPKYNGTTMDSTTNIPEVKTYSDFVGTDGTAAGTAGLVPAPATTDAGKFLKADGTWDTAGGSSVTVVQTTGTSTTDVMSQNATTSMIFQDPSTKRRVQIGDSANANAGSAIAIGQDSGVGSVTSATSSISIGADSRGRAKGAIALGAYSGNSNTYSMSQGEMHIGTRDTSYGYNTSNYRLLTGLYDGQSDHDAVTVAQVNATIDAINTALSTNIPHIGAIV